MNETEFIDQYRKVLEQFQNTRAVFDEARKVSKNLEELSAAGQAMTPDMGAAVAQLINCLILISESSFQMAASIVDVEKTRLARIAGEATAPPADDGVH
jgi:hypothetical protein